MKRGDVLLFKNTDFLGKIITFFTFGKYSHTAIYWGNGQILEISPLYLKVIPLSKKKSQDYDVGVVNNHPYSIEMKLKEIKKMLKKIKWYGVLNALFFAFLKGVKWYRFRRFMFLFEGKRGVVCSEVAAVYLESLGLKTFKYIFIPNSLISPGEFPKAFFIKIEKSC